MKSWITVILLLQMFLLNIVGSVSAPHIREDIKPKDEITSSTTGSTVDTTIVETTEPIIEEIIKETIEETEPIVDNTAPETSPEENTEPTIQVDNLVYLGTFKLTAYCSCYTCCGKHALNRPVDENGDEVVYGAAGVRLEAGVSIAVDPRVITYGTRVVINGHIYTAQDTGGNISGNRIDVYFDDHQEAKEFGVKHAEVFIYGL